MLSPPGSVETSVEGVYEVKMQDHEYRQFFITAAGTGCMAAMLAERWLSSIRPDQEFHQSG